MRSLFSFFKDTKLAFIIAIALLIVQAFCELSLPAYTSDILNIGLTQNGIEDAVPNSIRKESLDEVCMLISDEDEAVVRSAYTADEGDDIYTFNGSVERKTLNSILIEPEAILYYVQQAYSSSQTPHSPEEILSAYNSGMVSKEEINAMVSSEENKISVQDTSFLEQVAVLFVANEYTAMGISLEQLQTDYLWYKGGQMILLSLLMVAVSVLAGLVASLASSKIGRNLRKGIYEKVMSFSTAEMNYFSTASLITRSTNDIQQIQMIAVIILRMVLYAPILAVGGIIQVINTSTGMEWIIVLAIAIVGATLVILGKMVMPKFKLMQKLVDRVNLVSREILTGLLPIRAFAREKHEEARFDKANTDLYKTQLFTNRVMTFLFPVIMFVMNGVSVLIVWEGAKGATKGDVQIGDITAFLTYSIVIIMSFLILSMISILLPRAAVAADRIKEVLTKDISLADPENPEDDKLNDPEGVVRFDHVNFRFPDADEDILTDIDFTAENGKTTAIIGSTGAGKSTLINLIMRFYDVTGGAVTIDGVDIRNITQHKLHSLIGYVPQKGVLFSGDVESNIKFADPGISDEKMIESADVAQASGFIGELDGEYHAPISQGGSNVSGGQRQRLSIARALAKGSRILLFDDSFSALDYKTDLALRKALENKIGGATVIIVAQRISTIMNADQILVIDEGRIAGIGRHKDLMQTCSVYQEIARSQLSEAELAVEGGVC